jgi:hypothetical protein
MLFFVQNDPPHQLFKGHEVAAMLKSELQKQKADFLIFRALEISTVSKLWAVSTAPTNIPMGTHPGAHRGTVSLVRK